jgi:multidrug efflux pump subunit AcrA (membrane-fusion protein)
MNLRRFIAPLVAVLVLSGLGTAAYLTRESWVGHVFPDTTKPTTPDPHAEPDEHEEDEVHLSDMARRNLKLELGRVSPRPYWRTVPVPGIVVERPGETERAVTTRLGGVVTKVSAKPGDRVTPGQRLFTIEPTGDILRTQVELAKAVKDLAIYTTARDGVARQVDDKTRPANDLVEPQKQVALAANAVDGLKGQLRAWKLTGPQIEQVGEGKFVAEIDVTAPDEPAAAAEDLDVHELKVRLGDTVQPGQTLCVLGSHRRLYVEGHAFTSEAGVLAHLMEAGEKVRAEFVGDKPTGSAELPALPVARLSHNIDPTTRTFAFYLPLDNQPSAPGHDGHAVWRYRPGQRVRLRVPVEKLGDAVLVLPVAAVVREGAEAFVFEGHGDHFHRIPVRVLYEDRTEVVIDPEGVSAKAKLVLNQATALNRAMKAGGEEGHHHDHEH